MNNSVNNYTHKNPPEALVLINSLTVKLPYKRFDESTFSSLQEIENGLKQIKHEISRFKSMRIEMSFEELESLFFKYIRHLPHMINTSYPLNSPLYRVRVLKEEENPNLISTYSYPPPECTHKGRANIDHHPVFYCSIDQNTAIRETVMKSSGSDFYLSKWEAITPFNLMPTTFLFDTDSGLNEGPLLINNNLVERFDKMSKDYQSSTSNAMKYLFFELGKWFLEPDYTFSSFIGHHYLYKNTIHDSLKTDAIFYPSIQANKRSTNIALSPKLVDTKLKLTEVYQLRFEEEGNGEIRTSVLRKGIPDDHKIIKWKVPVFREKDIIVKGFELQSDVPRSEMEFNKVDKKFIAKSTKAFLLSEEVRDCFLAKLSECGSDPETERVFQTEINIEDLGYKHFLEMVGGTRFRFETSKVHIEYKSVYEGENSLSSGNI